MSYLLFLGAYGAVVGIVFAVSAGFFFRNRGLARLNEFTALVGACEVGGAILALALMARLVDRRPLSTIGFPLSRAVQEFAAGVLIGALIFLAAVALLVFLGFEEFVPHAGTLSAAALLVSVPNLIFAAASEEILTRGYAFQELWRNFSAWVALIVTSMLFLLMHSQVFAGPGRLILATNIFAGGLLFAFAYMRSGALWLPIGIHFAWNFMQGPVLGIPVTGIKMDAGWHPLRAGGPVVWTGGTLGVEGGYACLFGLALGAAIIFFVFRRDAGGRDALCHPLLPRRGRRRWLEPAGG